MRCGSLCRWGDHCVGDWKEYKIYLRRKENWLFAEGRSRGHADSGWTRLFQNTHHVICRNADTGTACGWTNGASNFWNSAAWPSLLEPGGVAHEYPWNRPICCYCHFGGNRWFFSVQKGKTVGRLCWHRPRCEAIWHEHIQAQ